MGGVLANEERVLANDEGVLANEEGVLLDWVVATNDHALVCGDEAQPVAQVEPIHSRNA